MSFASLLKKEILTPVEMSVLSQYILEMISNLDPEPELQKQLLEKITKEKKRVQDLETTSKRNQENIEIYKNRIEKLNELIAELKEEFEKTTRSRQEDDERWKVIHSMKLLHLQEQLDSANNIIKLKNEEINNLTRIAFANVDTEESDILTSELVKDLLSSKSGSTEVSNENEIHSDSESEMDPESESSDSNTKTLDEIKERSKFIIEITNNALRLSNQLTETYKK